MSRQKPSQLFTGVFKKDVLADRITDRLLSLIRERQLRPGDRLPPERELAAMMQVSRPSLREALRALSIMNVVDIRQGSGVYVTSLRPELLVEHLDFVISLDDSTYLQLLEARLAVEPALAALAARRVTDEEIAELEATLDRLQRSAGDHQAFLEADLALHEIIARTAGNPVLARFMASVHRLGIASRQRTVAIPGVAERVAIDHQAIVHAIKSRDPAAAAAAVQRHLGLLKQKLTQEALAEEPAGSLPPAGSTK